MGKAQPHLRSNLPGPQRVGCVPARGPGWRYFGGAPVWTGPPPLRGRPPVGRGTTTATSRHLGDRHAGARRRGNGNRVNMRALAHREKLKVPNAPKPLLNMIGSLRPAKNSFSVQWQSRPRPSQQSMSKTQKSCLRNLVSILPQHLLMRIASNDSHFRSVCFRTSRPLTLFLTTETDSAMPCYSWGSSLPISYGYKRGVLQMPQQGGSNRRSLALSEGASFDARPGII